MGTKTIHYTTEIKKIPITVVSRCQRFDLTRIRSKELLDQFNPQESPEITKYHFLYGTDITITSEKDKFIILVENLHQIKHIKFIHNILFKHSLL